MTFEQYIIFLVAILVCTAFATFASVKVHRTYSKYNAVANSSGMSGYDAAARIMYANGVTGISIGRVKGTLSDHYHPKHRIVNLSESTYSNRSVAAVAVAAHEMGHVMQNQRGYLFYRVRTAIVPLVNFGCRMAFPLVLIGVVLDFILGSASKEIGFYIAMAGVILYGGSFVFALVTLPVELNASRRAKKMLVEEGILAGDEMRGARKVLSAAAMTYLASLLTSFVYFLRFFIYVLAIFGRGGRRR